MGLIHAKLELVSAEDVGLERKGYIEKSQIKKEIVTALVNSGAYMMCINEHIQNQLDLMKVGSNEAELANETIIKLDVVVL